MDDDAMMDSTATRSTSCTGLSTIVEALRSSAVAYNQNFDSKCDQLRLDLMFRWMRCPSNLGRVDVSLSWFERLFRHHCEPSRHYHTLMHLEEMFMYWDLLTRLYFNGRKAKPMTASDHETIVLAIFFHDAIYNVHSSTNEEDSAALFQTYVKELEHNGVTFSRDLEHAVVQLILATKQHEVSLENPICFAVFLDLDMAVLGKEARAYSCYASLIRTEYHHVPHEVYCEKRANVLEEFLKQPQIYGIQVMLEALEQRARDNLTEEIQCLRRGQIPNGRGRD
jgi:predicted metal-dependent HD superfamily phosphohydrolase